MHHQAQKRNKKNKTKPFWGIVCFAFFSMTIWIAPCFAQKNPIPDTAISKKTLTIEDRLVQLALDGPIFKKSESQNTILEYQLKKTKNSWLNLLTVNPMYNFRSQTRREDPNGSNIYLFTGLNIGLTLPLGIIFSKGTDIKISKEQVRVSKYNQEQLAREIKVEILVLYRQYTNVTRQVLMQNKVVDEVEIALLRAEKNFKDDIINIEMYNAASKKYNDEFSNKLNLELTQYEIKLNIEKIIGAPLETVLY